MKMTYIIIAVIILVGLLVAISFRNKTEVKVSDKTPIENIKDNARPKETTLDENPYESLKRLAYSTQYSQLNLPNVGDKEVLYGTLMDWDYEGEAIITLGII